MSKKIKADEGIRFAERSHAFKMKVVREIENGLISRNYAAKKYLATRSSIYYWFKKLSTMDDSNNKSLQKEIKKLKEEIEELKFMNQVYDESLDELFKKYNVDPKKSYAGQLRTFAKELQKKLK
ncbi:MAG: DNA-binding protein [Sphingobacteriales bacterium]|nr:MAG: DNA-binding protein [Sphingobacteriales bacterium]